jgi:hypothetical protein
MRTPAGQGGRTELAGRAGDDDTRTRNNSPSVAQRATTSPVPSLTAVRDHLDRVGLCACWVAPPGRRCRRWPR